MMLDQLIRQTRRRRRSRGERRRPRSSWSCSAATSLAGAAVSTRSPGPSRDEADLPPRYDRNFAEAEPVTEYNAAHILVETEEEASALKAELDGGAAFGDAGRANSTGPSGPNRGDLGWFTADQMVRAVRRGRHGAGAGRGLGSRSDRFRLACHPAERDAASRAGARSWPQVRDGRSPRWCCASEVEARDRARSSVEARDRADRGRRSRRTGQTPTCWRPSRWARRTCPSRRWRRRVSRPAGDRRASTSPARRPGSRYQGRTDVTLIRVAPGSTVAGAFTRSSTRAAWRAGQPGEAGRRGRCTGRARRSWSTPAMPTSSPATRGQATVDAVTGGGGRAAGLRAGARCSRLDRRDRRAAAA